MVECLTSGNSAPSMMARYLLSMASSPASPVEDEHHAKPRHSTLSQHETPASNRSISAGPTVWHLVPTVSAGFSVLYSGRRHHNLEESRASALGVRSMPRHQTLGRYEI